MPKRAETTEADAPKRTPSFVCEVPLHVSVSQERLLLRRFENARQVYNACLSEAKRRVTLVRQAKSYQRAKGLPKDDPVRPKLFAQVRTSYGFSEYALHRYATTLRKSGPGARLDANTVQKLATRAYLAVNKLLLGQARRVRFKGKQQLDSVEGKVADKGIRWCKNRVEWSGLILPALLDSRDKVQVHGLASPVKYVRLVRRRFGEKTRFYAQLICEGTPYHKERHTLGEGIVGLDLGPQTIAIVSEQSASLQVFCPETRPNAKHLRRLDRKMDRQRRANNANNFDEKGRVKKGAKHWHVSERQKRTQIRRREYYRRLAATRKREQGQLVHQVFGLGNHIHLENLSYKAWQRRFGKSVALRAPGLFVSILVRAAASARATVVQINARRAKLSQTCHCGVVSKKRLSQRHHRCSCGVSAQRDLYSAFLACHVDPETSLLNASQAASAWLRAEPLVQTAFQRASQNQLASGGKALPASFGVSRAHQSQSESSAQGNQANAKGRNAVARRQRRVRVRQRQR